MDGLTLLRENRKFLWVAGSRHFEDKGWMIMVLAEQPDDTLLITGAAPGADSIAEGIWRKRQQPYIGIPAAWRKQGNLAGPLRNEVIGYLEPDELLVFPGGAGTYNAVEVAERRGIPVVHANAD